MDLNQIEELKSFLGSAKMPEPPFKINSMTTVVDPKGFKNMQLHRLRQYPIGSRYWQTAFRMLTDLKTYIVEHGESESGGAD